MISESTRFLAQPSEMRLTVIIVRRETVVEDGAGPAPVPPRVGRRERPGAVQKQETAPGGAVTLLLRGTLLQLGGFLLAFQVGLAAGAFDDGTELLAHGVGEKRAELPAGRR